MEMGLYNIKNEFSKKNECSVGYRGNTFNLKWHIQLCYNLNPVRQTLYNFVL